MKFALPVALALLTLGCGGDVAGAFQNSIYIEIKTDASLNPPQAFCKNGARVTFINNDEVGHSVVWSGSLVESGTVAGHGARFWFDLPPAVTGTTFNYRLDGNGAIGTVTITSQ